MLGRASFVAAILVSFAAHAAPLVFFPFSADLTTVTVAPNYSTTGVDTTHLSNAYVGNDGYGNVFEAYPAQNATSASTALANNSFFSVTVGTTLSGGLDLQSISFDVGKGGSSDPRGYAIYGSLDGFATPLLSVQLPTGTQTAPAPSVVNLPTAYATQSSATFEFFVYTPSNTNNSVDFSNLSFNSISAVPEPRTAAMLATGVLALAGVTVARRRRRSV